MKYKGIIKQSRTFDAIAILTLLDVLFVAFLANGSALTTPETYATISIVGKVGLAALRMVTTGPVGQK